MARRLVVLTASADARTDYDVRLGPLWFVTTADTVSETVGDGLDAVGAALVATERRPRPLKLKLPVRGGRNEIDVAEAGRRLRRQIRALLDNPRWRLGGFYLTWDADPDLDGWLLVGGAELSEADPGVAFGEFELELSDVYIVGRPGTHRPGRRASIADRRTGLVARDTRRTLYSLDFDTQALPAEPFVVPGDVVDMVSSGNRPVASLTLGPLRGGRRLWRTASAQDAEVVTYLPDEAVLVDRNSYLDLDELGAVRVWDLSNAIPYPPDPVGYTAERGTDPDIYLGWERVVGDVLTPRAPLAIDNGACRVIWLGAGSTEGLAIEYWDDTLGHYRRAGRVLHALGVREQRVVEATPERAVVEWRAGQYALRAILQRGWWGPRLESYDDGGGTARLEYAPDIGGAVTVPAQTPTWVRSISGTGTGAVAMLWAQGSADEIVDTTPAVLFGTGATFRRTRVLVAQLGAPPGPTADALASLSLIDARAVPVLVGRR